LKLACSILVLIFMVAQCVAYVTAIRKKKGVSPALSTWIIFLIGTSLSMTTYVLAKKKDLLSGAMLGLDFLGVAAILVAILVCGDRSMRFRPFEKSYLASCITVVGYGLATGDAFGSNLFAQVIIVAGYLPTFQKFLREKVNSESYFAWSMGLLSSMSGLALGLFGHDTLATIYAIRTFVLITIVLIIMFACDVRQSRLRTS